MMYTPIFSRDVSNYINKRVCIIGKVVKLVKKPKYNDLIVLDPFGKVTVRSFEKLELKEFSTILVLGRVRTFKDTIYIAPDRMVEISPEEEVFWRKRHVELYKRRSKPKREPEEQKEKREEQKQIPEQVPKSPTKKDLRSLILKAIEELDKGDGVTTKELSEHLAIELEKVEEIVEELLALGEIYEASLGKLKILK